MDTTRLGSTLLEQMPPEYKTGEHRHAKKPWLIIILVFVLISFGLFWIYEQQNVSKVSTPPLSETPLSSPSTELPVESSSTTPEMDIADLQAAAINIPIPDF